MADVSDAKAGDACAASREVGKLEGQMDGLGRRVGNVETAVRDLDGKVEGVREEVSGVRRENSQAHGAVIRGLEAVKGEVHVLRERLHNHQGDANRRFGFLERWLPTIVSVGAAVSIVAKLAGVF